MASEPIWIAVVAPSVSIAIAVIGVGWSRARTSGQDSTRLTAVEDDCEALKSTTSEHSNTLASMTSIHENQAEDISDLQSRMRQLEGSHSELKGRVDASNHGRAAR